ncbi:CAF17-like 4Fe-4S cluster assembly/insertion protein YgfZ [Aquabacterium parvum]|jgi:folate-binding protein YgfZ|uniref:CAF17-like 4Fe-4S cluster assembly/insertion protein YgfZ n=1 Tax=Aquabacterium parvum TaxID=70584 RepID=UPI000718BAF0|nr:folate-binding protein YgfZ [Aquabacterium parvum]MBU0914808.1 folate-binding protein [Gammaproteobacteria bacterium]
MNANLISLTQPVSSWQGALPLSDLAVIRAEGPDAAAFLHGQLSQDVNHLGPTEARLAANCSAKGRMQASALLLRPADEQVWLLTDAGILPGWLKRLKMFVLRSKVQLTEGGLQAWGLAGESASKFLGDAAKAPVWSSQPLASGQLVRLPDVQQVPRWLWLGAPEAAAWLTDLPALPESAWSSLEVLSGIPRVTEATFDQFVPQMVNFELVGGVNFQKGCYPGQEIVARSQYRGSVKRRAFLAEVQGSARPGQEVFASSDTGQPAGMVVLAAQLPQEVNASNEAPHVVLLELKLASAADVITLGAADGPALRLLPLPYDMPSPDGDA